MIKDFMDSWVVIFFFLSLIFLLWKVEKVIFAFLGGGDKNQTEIWGFYSLANFKDMKAEFLALGDWEANDIIWLKGNRELKTYIWKISEAGCRWNNFEFFSSKFSCHKRRSIDSPAEENVRVREKRCQLLPEEHLGWRACGCLVRAGLLGGTPGVGYTLGVSSMIQPRSGGLVGRKENQFPPSSLRFLSPVASQIFIGVIWGIIHFEAQLSLPKASALLFVSWRGGHGMISSSVSGRWIQTWRMVTMDEGKKIFQ